MSNEVHFARRNPIPDQDYMTLVNAYANDPDFRKKVDWIVQTGYSAGVKAGKFVYRIGSKLGQKIKNSNFFNKRPRTDGSSSTTTSAAIDPQASDVFHKFRQPALGAQALFTGAEVVERPLSYRLSGRESLNPLKAFLRDFNLPKKYTSQFACQYVGDDQLRSCQGLVFRHVASLSTVDIATRVLKPNWTYKPVTIGSAPGTQITDLPYNFFDASIDNMKTMVAPLNIYDMLALASSITPPAGNLKNDIFYSPGASTTTTGQSDINQVDSWGQTSSALTTAVPSWVANYLNKLDDPYTSTNFNVARSPKIVFASAVGGVQLYFENKHPVGAFIEIIVYKNRRDAADVSPSFFNSSSDSIMSNLEAACGVSYVNRVCSMRANDYGSGDSPSRSDVTTSPYYPLLPKPDVRFYPTQCNFSEKHRMKFALGSGHKRSVRISFGGMKFDPRSMAEAWSSEQVVLVIAINGQMISGLAQLGSENLITGDACSGHNVLVRGQYYERIYPLQCTRGSTLFTQQSMDPRITTSVAGVTFSPYIMIPAQNSIRNGNLQEEAGKIVDNFDGNSMDAEL